MRVWLLGVVTTNTLRSAPVMEVYLPAAGEYAVTVNAVTESDHETTGLELALWGRHEAARVSCSTPSEKGRPNRTDAGILWWGEPPTIRMECRVRVGEPETIVLTMASETTGGMVTMYPGANMSAVLEAP